MRIYLMHLSLICGIRKKLRQINLPAPHCRYIDCAGQQLRGGMGRGHCYSHLAVLFMTFMTMAIVMR